MGNDSKNLQSSEAAKKIKDLAEAARTCMMITGLDKKPFSVSPMEAQKVDEAGRIYFFSAKNATKIDELQSDPYMHLTFANQGKSEYLSLYGTAEVYRNQQEIDEMYSAFLNTWFEGKDDPNITLIRFSPEEGHYWDTLHGKFVQLAGMAYGAVTGKQTDDGLEGELKM